MLGYLCAAQDGSTGIIDTDDDNYPSSPFGFPGPGSSIAKSKDNLGLINIYQYFTDQKIWPRGLPLHLIRSKFDFSVTEKSGESVAIWQSLADGDSDVDAIYRLTSDELVVFERKLPIVLGHGTFAPLNSQSTYFEKVAFPLLYLPAFVTFRFTDILRGLVAQPILQASNLNIGFISPVFSQVRNAHDYMQDFESEIPMYLRGEKTLEIAYKHASKNKTISENLLNIYEKLYENKIVVAEELHLLSAWIQDISKI
jgi:hypothetical protein